MKSPPERRSVVVRSDPMDRRVVASLLKRHCWNRRSHDDDGGGGGDTRADTATNGNAREVERGVCVCIHSCARVWSVDGGVRRDVLDDDARWRRRILFEHQRRRATSGRGAIFVDDDGEDGGDVA